ncbi:MAG TPA: Npt1/Npt2 family nucleotide transporter [Polyangiaceae bacterium]|nr:Npt1/Npt2 family nucleotide transporter [Polyangiaceae bacterium]
MQEPTQDKGPLERALSLVTEVRAGEGVVALLLSLNVFLLMTAYLVIKPVREGLILAMQSGAEYKSYMSAAIAVTLLVAVPAYARFSDRLPKNRLVFWVTIFFASHLVLFFLGSFVEAIRVRLGLVFYLWLGIFNMMVVAQFWAFANDLYDEEQGKRLFPLLGVGQTVGALAGSAVAALLLESVKLGLYQMLLAGGALLVLSAALTVVVHRRHRAGVTEKALADEAAPVQDKSGAFRMVFQHKYLTLLAAFSLLFSFVNTNGEYMLGRLLQEDARDQIAAGILAKDAMGAHIGAAFNRFYLYVGIGTVLLQTFVVSRLVKHAGLRIAFYVLPAIALADATMVAVLPVLGVIFVGKIAENSVDYSVNNTVRNILWLPTTQEMKYKAKQAVDTFFVRMGDVSSALLVFVGTTFLGFGVRNFAMVNVVLICAWLVLAAKILRERLKLPGAHA